MESFEESLLEDGFLFFQDEVLEGGFEFFLGLFDSELVHDFRE